MIFGSSRKGDLGSLKAKMSASGVLTFETGSPTKSSAKLSGRNYNVYPAIMMVEGAYYPKVTDTETPVGILFTSDELEKSVRSWDGRPVSIGHPVDSETCNTPAVYNTQCIGYIFNTIYDPGRKCLKCDIWVESPKGDYITGLIDSGDKMEVSIGAFGNFSESYGEFNGTKHSLAIRDIAGDHLALLPDSTGACSWENGCGVRAEKDAKLINSEIMSKARTPSYSGIEDISWGNVNKDLTSYIKSYYSVKGKEIPKNVGTSVESLPSEVKAWIASKTLLGNPNADTADDLIFFPVVNPGTNKLNAGALRAVLSGRGSQAKISDGAKNSSQKVARKLLDKEFKKVEDKTENKKENVSATVVGAVAAETRCKDVSLEDYIAAAPLAVKAVLDDAVKEVNGQRQELIKNINSVEGVALCNKFLSAAGTNELKGMSKLADLAKSVNAQPIPVERKKVDYGISNVSAEAKLGYMKIPSINWR